MLHFCSIIYFVVGELKGREMMNEKEIKKLNTIKKLINKEITIKEAMFELDMSRQQIYRLTKLYNEQGENGFVHKSRGKDCSFKITEEIIEEIKNLYMTEYYDYNFQAFYDELTENEKYKDKYEISYSSLYNKFLSDDIISPIAHKGTINYTMKK